MGGADYVIFAPDWREARGCCIEHMCALEYGVPILEPDCKIARLERSDGEESI